VRRKDPAAQQTIGPATVIAADVSADD